MRKDSETLVNESLTRSAREEEEGPSIQGGVRKEGTAVYSYSSQFGARKTSIAVGMRKIPNSVVVKVCVVV